MNLNDLSKKWLYPGGEVGVRAIAYNMNITARLQSSDDIMQLLMFINSAKLKDHPYNCAQHVFIPYLPYARQDRKTSDGDPNAIEVMAKLLASTGVREFSTLDVHSPVAKKKFAEAGCVLTSHAPDQYIDKYIDQVAKNRDLWLVAPDDGAARRVESLYLKNNVSGIIYCQKVRDPATGQLSGFSLKEGPESVSNRSHIMVIDDICDGGGTFHGVAKVLIDKYGAEVPLHLWTTHGIYSKGVDDLLKTFLTLGSTNSFTHNHKHNRLFTVEVNEL